MRFHHDACCRYNVRLHAEDLDLRVHVTRLAIEASKSKALDQGLVSGKGRLLALAEEVSQYFLAPHLRICEDEGYVLVLRASL